MIRLYSLRRFVVGFLYCERQLLPFKSLFEGMGIEDLQISVVSARARGDFCLRRPDGQTDFAAAEKSARQREVN